MYYVSAGDIQKWQSDAQTPQHARMSLDTRALVEKLRTRGNDDVNNDDDIAGYLKVSHGTLSSPVNVDSEVWTYVYDANGNIEDIISSDGTRAYGYDTLNRLIDDTRPGASTETLDYDRNGNRTAKIVDALIGYVPNSNQLSSDPNGVQ